MDRYYIKASQSLYLKTILPLLIHLKGEFYFFSSLKNLIIKKKDLKKIINNNHTNFNLINLKSITYISKLINLDFFKYINYLNIKFTYFNLVKNNSTLICTTKDLKFAKKNYKKFKKIIIVGYQHLPILGELNMNYSKNLIEVNNNPFFLKNDFNNILKNIDFKKTIFPNLFYQNKVRSITKKIQFLYFIQVDIET